MSYKRVIPRDLFNEANLLKCYGQIYIQLEQIGLQDNLIHEDDEFEVQQTINGELTVNNIFLEANEREYRFYRPLNSREPYPLYTYDHENDIDVSVFNDDGTFTEEMLKLIA